MDNRRVPDATTVAGPRRLPASTSRGLFEAFPDLQAEVLDAVSDGEFAAARVRLSGTHESEFAGIPATGKRVVEETSEFCRVNSDGLFTEHWAYADNLSIMQQLGAIPE